MSSIKAPLLTCLAIAHAVLLASAASAQSIEAAHAAFVEGQFVEAAELAEALKTSEGYSLAAECLAIYSYHIAKDNEKQALFERATRLAQEAVRLDPHNPDAYLHLAHALGRYTQTIGIMEAIKKGYPEKVHEALEEALRLAPEMAVVHMSLAAWHAEARHSGGFMAGVLYGASEEEALAHYKKALELAPGDKTVLAEYAHGLLLLNRDANHGQARDLLARAIEVPAKDAYNRIIHQIAVERLATLEAQPPKPPQHPGRLGQ